MRIAVGPGEFQNRVGKFSTLLLIQLAHLEKDLRHDGLIEPAIAGRRQRRVFPLKPARGIGERAVLLRKARAGQPVDRGLDALHLLRSDTRRFPKLARLVRIDLAYHQPICLLERLDILLGVRADHHAVHPEGEEALDAALVHVVPNLSPGVIAVGLGKIIERPVVFLARGRAVHRFEKRDGELRCVLPIVHRLPGAGLGRLWGDALQIGVKVRVGGIGNLQIAGQQIE